MTMAPWGQQPAVAPDAPQKQPPKQKKNWWEQGLANLEQAGGFSMPWQAKHWDPQFTPEWARVGGAVGGVVGGLAGLGALGLAAPGLLAGAGRMAMPPAAGMQFPGIGRMIGQAGREALTAVPRWMRQHPVETLFGLGAGAIGLANLPGGEALTPPPSLPGGIPPTVADPGTPPTSPTDLPEPGDKEKGKPQPTFFTDAQGNRWQLVDPLTNKWEMVQPPYVRGESAEQTAERAKLDREARSRDAAAQQKAQMERLTTEEGIESRLWEERGIQERGMQEAAAAQAMAQMYAADPYKYWAQMGLGTPEAVSRLTQGEQGIAPGEQFQPGVPLSMPSQQWWGNLLPSEQQQISGAVNWMGIDPADWQATRERMIPGMASRQMEARFRR